MNIFTLIKGSGPDLIELIENISFQRALCRSLKPNGSSPSLPSTLRTIRPVKGNLKLNVFLITPNYPTNAVTLTAVKVGPSRFLQGHICGPILPGFYGFPVVMCISCIIAVIISLSQYKIHFKPD